MSFKSASASAGKKVKDRITTCNMTRTINTKPLVVGKSKSLDVSKE
jgi:hypothetical protein